MAETYAIHVAVFFRNESRRENALAAVNDRFGSTAQWGTPTAERIVNRAGDPGVVATAWFRQREQRDSLWDDVDAAFGTGVNGPVTGSRAWTHDCLHDDNVGFCTIGQSREWA